MPYCYAPLLLLLPATLHAQTAPPDTARGPRVLPAATVVGYGQNLPLRRTAAAVGVVDARVIGRFSAAALTAAVNTLPGVRLEERATGSYRLNIRGSALRSPYGVRNVKVYYNDIPFTDATGSTALNLLDAATIGRIEVIKGPAGSVYGAGTGGVALFTTRRPVVGEARAQVGVTVGSYGLRRYSVAAESGTARQLVAGAVRAPDPGRLPPAKRIAARRSGARRGAAAHGQADAELAPALRRHRLPAAGRPHAGAVRAGPAAGAAGYGYAAGLGGAAGVLRLAHGLARCY